MSDPASSPSRFGTFTGVFTPTLLTILGVIMYVRLPWVVGNAGLLGAWTILALAMGITLCTGLSLSSIATNTRLGAGGPYAIISKSLGFEVGGSIGIPLYLSRPLGTAMYIFGFREGWLWLFPGQEPYSLLIDLMVFAMLFAVAYKSAELAFKIQYLIMAVIALSIVSILAAPSTTEMPVRITWWGDYPGFPETFEGTTFWTVFAVFFPATTGILAGANMSGDLDDPRRSIPRGTLWAILISGVIYFLLAWWCAVSGTMEELQTNYNFMIDNAYISWLVMLGLLGATFSSALASMVGGPRILMAMGEHKLLPYSQTLAAKAADGEPRNAVFLTGVLTLAVLMFRDLNAIAPMVTMFFLITYLVINLVLLFEQGLGLVSFRPTMPIHWAIPLMGAVGCVFSMFIINPTFGLISVITVVGIYASIRARGVTLNNEDVRSSVFEAVAEWAAVKVSEDPEYNPRAWKPHLLVPVEDPTEVRGEIPFIRDLVSPEGTVKLLGMTTEAEAEDMEPALQLLEKSLLSSVYTSSCMIDSANFRQGVVTGLQALQSAFFRPNLVLMTAPETPERFETFTAVIQASIRLQVGVLMLGLHRRGGLGRRQTVNVWVSPRDWDKGARAAFAERGNLNLLMLMGYRVLRCWNGELNVIMAVPTSEDEVPARAFLREACDLARLPESARQCVLVGNFDDVQAEVPQADLTIIGLQPSPEFSFCHQMIETTKSSVLFVADSGRESALA